MKNITCGHRYLRVRHAEREPERAQHGSSDDKVQRNRYRELGFSNAHIVLLIIRFKARRNRHGCRIESRALSACDRGESISRIRLHAGGMNEVVNAGKDARVFHHQENMSRWLESMIVSLPRPYAVLVNEKSIEDLESNEWDRSCCIN